MIENQTKRPFDMSLEVPAEQALEVGQTPIGLGRILGVTGGTFEAPELRGLVLGGDDWPLPDEVIDRLSRGQEVDPSGVLSSCGSVFRDGGREICVVEWDRRHCRGPETTLGCRVFGASGDVTSAHGRR